MSIINFDLPAFDLAIALYRKKTSISFPTRRAPRSLAAFWLWAMVMKESKGYARFFHYPKQVYFFFTLCLSIRMHWALFLAIQLHRCLGRRITADSSWWIECISCLELFAGPKVDTVCLFIHYYFALFTFIYLFTSMPSCHATQIVIIN